MKTKAYPTTSHRRSRLVQSLEAFFSSMRVSPMEAPALAKVPLASLYANNSSGNVMMQIGRTVTDDDFKEMRKDVAALAF